MCVKFYAQIHLVNLLSSHGGGDCRGGGRIRYIYILYIRYKLPYSYHNKIYQRVTRGSESQRKEEKEEKRKRIEKRTEGREEQEGAHGASFSFSFLVLFSFSFKVEKAP